MELILILLVAFLVVGPKDLPKVARALARFVKYVRGFIDEIKEETGLNEVTAEMEKMKSEVQEVMKDADVTYDLRIAQQDIRKDLVQIKKATLRQEEDAS